MNKLNELLPKDWVRHIKYLEITCYIYKRKLDLLMPRTHPSRQRDQSQLLILAELELHRQPRKIHSNNRQANIEMNDWDQCRDIPATTECIYIAIIRKIINQRIGASPSFESLPRKVLLSHRLSNNLLAFPWKSHPKKS